MTEQQYLEGIDNEEIEYKLQEILDDVDSEMELEEAINLFIKYVNSKYATTRIDGVDKRMVYSYNVVKSKAKTKRSFSSNSRKHDFKGKKQESKESTSAWDNITTSGYIQIDINETAILTFEDDEPEVSPSKKYNGTQYLFDVDGGGKQFRTFSNVLMAELSPFRPLSGKTLEITRTGEGVHTEYEVVEVEDEE